MVLSSDLIATAERMREELRQIEEGRIDIIVGTQLVAKGHHFPNSIWSASSMPISGSPMAIRAPPSAPFQLLHQVAGRAGREKPAAGRGFRQTHQPNHPVMRALIAGDREAFYDTEIAARERDPLSAVRPPREPRHFRARPPLGRRLRPPPAGAAPPTAVRVLGPAEAPVAVIRGRHRFRLLVKAARGLDLSGYLRGWLARAPEGGWPG